MIMIPYIIIYIACEWVAKKVAQACGSGDDTEGNNKRGEGKGRPHSRQNEEKFYKQLEDDSYETRGGG